MVRCRWAPSRARGDVSARCQPSELCSIRCKASRAATPDGTAARRPPRPAPPPCSAQARATPPSSPPPCLRGCRVVTSRRLRGSRAAPPGRSQGGMPHAPPTSTGWASHTALACSRRLGWQRTRLQSGRSGPGWQPARRLAPAGRLPRTPTIPTRELTLQRRAGLFRGRARWRNLRGRARSVRAPPPPAPPRPHATARALRPSVTRRVAT